jgi:asparagine synthase (glutamine-hydrolysing)
MCDEPFADSSIIPTYMVSKLAREDVNVSLSGDGGDELFAGYNRYLLAPSIWKRISSLPLSVRGRLSRLIDPGLMVPATALVRMADKLLPSERRQLLIADKTLKVVQAMHARDRAEFHHMLASYWADPLQMVIGAGAAETRFTDKSMQPDCPDFVHWMQTQDQATYLPDDILTKVDRASMAVSLEARVPVIDHRIVEFSHTLPLEMKIRSGSGKHLLRKILYKYVPPELIERPKQGFGLPIDEWLRGPLKAWAEELLDERRLRREGYLRPEPVKRAWKEHLSGRKNMPYHLWAVLMFQSWLGEVS